MESGIRPSVPLFPGTFSQIQNQKKRIVFLLIFLKFSSGAILSLRIYDRLDLRRALCGSDAEMGLSYYFVIFKNRNS